MVEKQQRAFLKQTGAEKPIMEILREAAAKNFAPLFRGTVPLMGHSLASAILGKIYGRSWCSVSFFFLSSSTDVSTLQLIFLRRFGWST